jgi:hypothetical protein
MSIPIAYPQTQPGSGDDPAPSLQQRQQQQQRLINEMHLELQRQKTNIRFLLDRLKVQGHKLTQLEAARTKE